MYVVVLVLCCWHTIHQVFRSIGYKSVRVDKDIPFDHNKGIVLNEKGRIVSGEQHVTLRHPCVCACQRLLLVLPVTLIPIVISSCCLAVD